MNRHLVFESDLEWVLGHLAAHDVLYCDTETTGLRPHAGDKIFSLIVGSKTDIFYFNFKDYEDGSDTPFLDPSHRAFKVIFNRPHCTYVFHNAKFDLSMLRASGIEVLGDVHCTMVTERILDSETMAGRFNLSAVSEKYGTFKEDAVKAYIDKHKLFTRRTLPGTQKTVKDLHFDQVPFNIMFDYACQDVEALISIYEGQIKGVEDIGCENVHTEEMKLVKTVFEIEWRGIRCDKDLCLKAMDQAQKKMDAAKDEYKRLTGKDFIDSGKAFSEVFEDIKDRWVMGEPTKTGKVNPSFDSSVLKTFPGEPAKLVLSHRDALNEYNFYAGFVDACDENNFIHTNLNQHGATTGRFSSSNPNLQNMTKNEDDELLAEYVVRRAIIPRKGHVFHMLDFKSMEYIVMLDYAARYMRDTFGVHKLIEMVKAGFDVHQATADLTGITRREAKTVNFALIFGSGNQLLAENLKSDVYRAKQLRNAIFSASPEIEELIQRATDAAKTRGYILTWKGRRSKISDRNFSYRAINYLVQGGSADIVKTAMNRVEDYLKDYETKMVLMIHDELVLDGPAHEAKEVVPKVAKIMSEAFEGKHLKLSVDIEHSFISLADKTKGIASGLS